MALWLVRAGKTGPFETLFLGTDHVYLGWLDIDWDLSKHKDREDLKDHLRRADPSSSPGRINSHAGQIWIFAKRMAAGDIIALPSKIKRVVYFGRVEIPYSFTEGGASQRHALKVKWLKDIPRDRLDKDLLFSLGSAMTICQIDRNHAERRVRQLLDSPSGAQAPMGPEPDTGEVFPDSVEIEEAALQEIAERIIANYKGHGLAEIVNAFLTAKGYTTHVSPPGADHGVDILASKGTLGFDQPRICVQVKNGDNPLERTVLDQLIGAMSNHKADFGMLVSWGGFKSSITQVEAQRFFNVRLWTHNEIIREFLRHYEDMPDEIKEIVPLKRIWILDKKDM